MPRLPRMSGRELIKWLELFGFNPVRQTGGHIVLKKKIIGGEIGTVVPNHKELAEGTVRGILKQAQISIDEFLEKYHN
jgi:predicted RNA binding protein YcfA (HicA-like mRNA interferase family)